MRPENATVCFPQRTQPAAPWVTGTRLLMHIIAAGAWTFFGAAGLTAQQTGPSEFQIKAAYIYNFGKFVKWPAVAPANQSGSFTICVLDGDPFGATLGSTLAGETVGGKPVAVKRIEKVQNASACHILFIGSAQEKDLKAILSALDEDAVLTVSDIPDFSRRGGMIQFVPEGNRIRFEINLEGAEKSHLVFPSELLKVAVAVRKPAGPGD
ncbi:MAG TPA: YfiR family protein [Edaphobacter sp.]|nr:YfiR family protein [Edaphobacter sp.]